MKTALLIIGDEILNGNTLDTNSNFAAKKLNENGFNITTKITIGDSKEQILDTIADLFNKVDFIITTGGLGPTKDDITKTTLAEYFNCELVSNPEILSYLEERFAKMGRTLNELNKTQALIPTKAEGIINPVGTAPVMWFNHNGKALVTLPGVPKEMQYLIENIVIPKAIETFKVDEIIHSNLYTVGIPESSLAEILAPVDEEIINQTSSNYYKLAYLPDFGIVKLRLSGIGKNKEEIQNQLLIWKDKIKTLAGQYIFSEEDKTNLSQIIGNQLIALNKTVSTAESCTGGYLAHLFTQNSGSSQYYYGSVISYDNSVKEHLLNVPIQILDEHGAVSKEVAELMVKGALSKLNTDYAIATTGIAGPDGGSEAKPVGTIWIAVGDKNQIISKSFRFNFTRTQNIHIFAITALDMLRKFIAR